MPSQKVISFFHTGDGFQPLLISDGWQVAQLNDREDLHADSVSQIERHDATDEVFVLIRGTARLVIATESLAGFEFEVIEMEQGVTYNIPLGVWHTIITSPAMQVMIVEKDRTHENGVVRRKLTTVERTALRGRLTDVPGFVLSSKVPAL